MVEVDEDSSATNAPVIGIDLGTTHSSVALFNRER